MAKGDSRRTRDRRPTPARGRKGSKNYQPARSGTGMYAPKAEAAAPIASKTKGFDYKGKTAKKDIVQAGGNTLDAKGKKKKRLSFKEHLASTGSRADNPLNWEFHYKAPTRTGSFRTGGKNSERRTSYASQAKSRAESAAKRSGKDVYDVQEIEYNTRGITEKSDTATAASKAKGGGFGSTRVASNVAAQKQKATRKGQAATGAFSAPTKKRGAIA